MEADGKAEAAAELVAESKTAIAGLMPILKDMTFYAGENMSVEWNEERSVLDIHHSYLQTGGSSSRVVQVGRRWQPDFPCLEGWCH